MKKSDIDVMPQFFDRYIRLVDDEDLMNSFFRHKNCPIDKKILNKLSNQRYAPGKWTIKDILQHVIDVERIMSYRALRFARNDNTPLNGFEESLYGNEANAVKRTVDDLLEELSIVRQSTISLYRNFGKEELMRKGSANNIEISVLALGFTIIGHSLHHWKVIEERYFPLLVS